MEKKMQSLFKQSLFHTSSVFPVQADMKLKHAQQQLKTKQAEVKKMDSGYKKDEDAFKAVKKQKEKLENEMKTLNYEGLLYQVK